MSESKLVPAQEQLLSQPCVTECDCKAQLDITDILFSPGFRWYGLTTKELMMVMLFYRTWNLDWPPKLDDKKPE